MILLCDIENEGGGFSSDNESSALECISTLSLNESNSSGNESTISSDSIHTLYELSNSSIKGSTPSFDILPSYQMHQNILNRPLSFDHSDAADMLPNYSSCSPSNGDAITQELSTVDLQENSVLNNINSIPVMPRNKDIKISIKLDKSDKSYVTNGDCISGLITVENASKKALPFEMFLVTFEGEMKVSTGIPEEKLYKYKNFLRMVDLGASWTDTDASIYDQKRKTYSGLPKDRILAPKTKYQKFFTFTMPLSSLQQGCTESLIDHSILPSTFGSTQISVDSMGLEDNIHEKFAYSDLSNPGCSIDYSVNARLITIDLGTMSKYIVKSSKKNSVCYISASERKDEQYYQYEKYKVSPSYQLNLLLKQIEHDINEVQTTIDAIDQDRRLLVYRRPRLKPDGDGDDTITCEDNVIDDSKRQNLYNDSINSLQYHHSVVDEQYIKRFKKDYRFFRKKKKPEKQRSSKSFFLPTTPSESLMSTSSSFERHDSRDENIRNFDCGALKISSDLNNELVVDFDRLISPLNKAGESKISLPLTIDFSYIMPSLTSAFDQSEFAKYFPMEPDVDLMYVNVITKGSPIPIELDFDWFTSRQKFRQTIKQQVFELSKKLKSLPKDALMPAHTLRALAGMSQLNYETGILSKAITVDAVKQSSIQYDEQQKSLNSKMHLNLVLNSSKLRSTLLVPDFQTCFIGRLYFLRLKFKANSSLFTDCEVDYDSQTEDVIKNLDGNYKFYLDVPISIKKVD